MSETNSAQEIPTATSRAWRDALLLVVLLAVFFGFELGSRALWHPDEGRYSEIPRAMAASGDYVTPRLNGVKYFEKPVLFYWMQAGSIKLFGVNEWALRLWPALLALAGCLAVYGAGRKLFGRRAGLIAAIVLATSPLYYLLGRIITLDMAVRVLLTGALLSFLLGVREPPGARVRCISTRSTHCARGDAHQGAHRHRHSGDGDRRLDRAAVGLAPAARDSPAHRPAAVSSPLRHRGMCSRRRPTPSSRSSTSSTNISSATSPRCICATSRGGSSSRCWRSACCRGSDWCFRHCAPPGPAGARAVNIARKFSCCCGLGWCSGFFRCRARSSSRIFCPCCRHWRCCSAVTSRTPDPAPEPKGLRAGFWFFLAATAALGAYLTVELAQRPEAQASVLRLGGGAYLMLSGLLLATLAHFFLGRLATVTRPLAVLAAGAALLVLALGAALPALDDKYSVKALALELKARLLPADEVTTLRAYYQDLPVYLARRITVVDWKGELEFGAAQEDVSGWMIGEAEFPPSLAKPEHGLYDYRARKSRLAARPGAVAPRPEGDRR